MVPIVSDDFNMTGSLLQILGTAAENMCLPRLSLVLGTRSSEIDDVSTRKRTVAFLELMLFDWCFVIVFIALLYPSHVRLVSDVFINMLLV